MLYLLFLTIYAIAAIYIVLRLVSKVVSWTSRLFVIAITSVVLTAIPFADEVWYRHQVNRLCSRDGGLHRYAVANNVPGFFDATGSFRGHDAYKLGFGYLEKRTDDKSPQFSRFSLDSDGKEIVEKIVAPTAQYTYGARSEFVSRWIKRNLFYVKDEHADVVLLEHVSYAFRAGWLVRLLYSDLPVPSYGCKLSTGNKYAGATDFILTVLQPVRR